MNKFLALCLLAALVSAAPQNLDDLTGVYSLWRPPTWPNFETCCYLQGANITRTGDQMTLKSIVMGPCAQYLPGTQGSASLKLEGKVSDLASTSGVKTDLQFFTTAGAKTLARQYNVVYSVEHSPAPVDILTFTQVGDSNCTFELRNDTKRPTVTVSQFYQKFLAKLEKVQSKLDSYFTKTAADFAGKFSLWRPPTWQNFSTCCYIMGANVTYSESTKEFTYVAIVMGPCAANLPGTNGVMKTKLTSGQFSDKTFTMSASYFKQDGNTHIADKTYTVTSSIELTPAPVDVITFHDINDKSDASCDFLLRKDTQ